MILQGPGDIQFRDVRYGDEEAVMTICSDWDGDGKRMRMRRAEEAVHGYVHAMTARPGDHPVLPDSRYREALISFMPNGDPLALVVYDVRGGNDPKNWPLAVATLKTQVFSIAPAYRSGGRMAELLNVLMRSAFEDTGVDVLTHTLRDSPAVRSHIQDRGYEAPAEKEIEKGALRETRIEVAFTKAQHQARMAANPSEARQRHVFIKDG